MQNHMGDGAEPENSGKDNAQASMGWRCTGLSPVTRCAMHPFRGWGRGGLIARTVIHTLHVRVVCIESGDRPSQRLLASGRASAPPRLSLGRCAVCGHRLLRRHLAAGSWDESLARSLGRSVGRSSVGERACAPCASASAGPGAGVCALDGTEHCPKAPPTTGPIECSDSTPPRPRHQVER